MDYSIVMPVFNREDLTQSCLETLLATLDGAGSGEVIVVDNGSRRETAEVLARFPWVRVIRNDTNLGFAAACNQGARAAAGRFVCHLNNDIIAQPGWLAHMIAALEPNVGAVGAQLLFPDDTLQHAGVALLPARFGTEGFGPYHLYWKWPNTTAAALQPTDVHVVTGACLLTPRDLFLELGGFDEIFWNGYEDVDYCLRVRQCGLRVVYEARAVLYHYESQSGVQRKRQIMHNVKTLGERWGHRVVPDHNRYWLRSGIVRREYFHEGQRSLTAISLPKTTIVVHGNEPTNNPDFMRLLCKHSVHIERIVWLASGAVPSGCQGKRDDQAPLQVINELFDERGDRYLAFVKTNTRLADAWLDELINGIEFGSEVVAATCVESTPPLVCEPCAADARCTLVNLRSLPRHVRVRAVDTIDGALVDLTSQAVTLGLGVRSVYVPSVMLNAYEEDVAFSHRTGLTLEAACCADLKRLEAACAFAEPAPTLASIVMLSWNAPNFTQLAIESIRKYTHSPYEIIIVDNGSGAETLAMLQALENVRVIYNAKNEGFAHGCNQGIANALGTHIVLLNNDVIVTDGWLENLLAAHIRDPLIGVSAPRSNRIVGHQQLTSVAYDSNDDMHCFAAARATEFAARHYRTDRAIGFCLCIARDVIDAIGGLDTRYGMGNFEDDDFCIRIRAAGYQIAVCEDVFIHHFGSVSFQANNVDYSTAIERNWRIFAARWGLPAKFSGGYNSTPLIARGFDRSRDYVALPAVLAKHTGGDDPRGMLRRSYQTAFVAVVDSDASWSRVGPVVTNYVKSLCADDSALFAIGVTGSVDAATIGARIARSIGRLQLDDGRVADIDVADVQISELEEWVAAIPAAARLRVAKDDRLAGLALATDRSPSGLLRTVRGDMLSGAR